MVLNGEELNGGELGECQSAMTREELNGVSGEGLAHAVAEVQALRG